MTADDRIPVSVIIMTKNEERVLARTLESVAIFDQVFVVDSHSVDRTVEIAEASGAEVVQFTWDGRYPKKKEWSLLNLPFKHDWVLYLDADELVTPALATELSRIFARAAPTHAAFEVELDYYFLGRRLRYGHRVTKRVLLHRSHNTWPHVPDLDVTAMWEVEGHYQPSTTGTIGHLRTRLQHKDIDPLFDYFARHNRYSDWEAYLLGNAELRELVQENRSSRGKRHAHTPLKPILFFVYSYVLRRGFLDGAAGFHYAIAHSFYFWQIHVKRHASAVESMQKTN